MKRTGTGRKALIGLGFFDYFTEPAALRAAHSQMLASGATRLCER